MKKFIARIKWHLKELNLTFSNKPSHYSVKRIERFLLFINALALFDGWILWHWSEISYSQITEAFVLNLAYAGFLVHSTQKEKRNDKPETPQPAPANNEPAV